MTLPPIDPVAVDEFWSDYRSSVDRTDHVAYTDVFHFGDHPAMADELLALVLSGRKRATASGLLELQHAGIAIPRVGDHWIVCDGRSRPRVVGTTTDVRVGPLRSVDDAFAFDEGEGDRTRADWLRQHSIYFRRAYAVAGLHYHSDIEVVFERFDVVHAP